MALTRISESVQRARLGSDIVSARLFPLPFAPREGQKAHRHEASPGSWGGECTLHRSKIHPDLDGSGPRQKIPLEVVSEAFSLTAAEAKVASMVAAGLSPEEIAISQGVSVRQSLREPRKGTINCLSVGGRRL